jgi:hypothetical protein
MQEGGDNFQRAELERDGSGADNDVVWVKHRQPGKTGLQLIVFASRHQKAAPRPGGFFVCAPPRAIARHGGHVLTHPAIQ